MVTRTVPPGVADEHLLAYQQHGYVVARGLFSSDEVAGYRDHYMTLRRHGAYPGDFAGVDATAAARAATWNGSGTMRRGPQRGVHMNTPYASSGDAPGAGRERGGLQRRLAVVGARVEEQRAGEGAGTPVEADLQCERRSRILGARPSAAGPPQGQGSGQHKGRTVEQDHRCEPLQQGDGHRRRRDDRLHGGGRWLPGGRAGRRRETLIAPLRADGDSGDRGRLGERLHGRVRVGQPPEDKRLDEGSTRQLGLVLHEAGPARPCRPPSSARPGGPGLVVVRWSSERSFRMSRSSTSSACPSGSPRSFLA